MCPHVVALSTCSSVNASEVLSIVPFPSVVRSICVSHRSVTVSMPVLYPSQELFTAVWLYALGQSPTVLRPFADSVSSVGSNQSSLFAQVCAVPSTFVPRQCAVVSIGRSLFLLYNVVVQSTMPSPAVSALFSTVVLPFVTQL